MTSRNLLALAAPGLFLIAALPASADPASEAVTQCRAEMERRFPKGAIRSYRIGEIAGTSRRPRVTFHVTADRRYEFRCTTDARGQVVTAAFDPPRDGRQLASGH